MLAIAYHPVKWMVLALPPFQNALGYRAAAPSRPDYCRKIKQWSSVWRDGQNEEAREDQLYTRGGRHERLTSRLARVGPAPLAFVRPRRPEVGPIFTPRLAPDQLRPRPAVLLLPRCWALALAERRSESRRFQVDCQRLLAGADP